MFFNTNDPKENPILIDLFNALDKKLLKQETVY